MRHRREAPEAPNGTMDVLFIRLIEWGREQGYRLFHLGSAPLSGLEEGQCAALWNKLGALICNRSEYFYNFRGLREYKENFSPVWSPLYIAAPNPLAIRQVLIDIVPLISGGIKSTWAM